MSDERNRDKSIMGEFLMVRNRKAHHAAKTGYYCVLVESNPYTKDFEKHLFLTLREYNELVTFNVEMPNVSFPMKQGRMYRYIIGKRAFNLVKVKLIDKSDAIVNIPDTLYERALKRVERNPEDEPRRGFSRDLLD